MQLKRILAAAAIALGVAAVVVGGTVATTQWEGDAVSYYQGKTPYSVPENVAAEDFDRDYA
ncbi:hypothetical protein [Phytomonospora endophytica]|uniref:Uncharacterized protein n=1 Tax=Phytomonospora endophytica TaxID=714109 RepID=A0A841FH45_9ACTN|nr:hypothetical protein [Phytomonospora endophytica]MBB6035194.1 hypothetical protein [Phytomonospora endophytica]GIG64057.1 hypothetical protein Pen01_03520 [Phytomonospora endophytica]